jgi:hypothetical protein
MAEDAAKAFHLPSPSQILGGEGVTELVRVERKAQLLVEALQ